jgi:peptidoglycan L-alanyl-D-glutamate endopeptidase CwlK
MSFVLDKRSAGLLTKAHPLLQSLIKEVCATYPSGKKFTISDSTRGRAAQEEAFRKGNTRAHFGSSAHNYEPAVALDILPSPLDWNKWADFKQQADFIMSTAKRLSIPLRWGGDWDGDGSSSDEKLLDGPHFELNPWRNFATTLTARA